MLIQPYFLKINVKCPATMWPGLTVPVFLRIVKCSCQARIHFRWTHSGLDTSSQLGISELDEVLLLPSAMGEFERSTAVELQEVIGYVCYNASIQAYNVIVFHSQVVFGIS